MEYNLKTKNDRMKYIYKSAKMFLLDISSNELEEKEINRYFNIVKSFMSKNDILYLDFMFKLLFVFSVIK